MLLLGVWKIPEEIDFSKLPDQFVLKVNHGCGFSYIVKDKDTLNIEDFCKKARKWFLEDFAFHSFEMQYHGIERYLFVEQYLENQSLVLKWKSLLCHVPVE